MSHFSKKLSHWIKYWITSVFMAMFFVYWVSYADLLWDTVEPAHNAKITIDLWKSINRVWKHTFEWEFEVDIGLNGFGAQKWPSIVVKTARILLMLTVALSVTMILYNGMMYIIQTWQGKEAKDLTKNITLIVVWILVWLFSVVIITLLQSVPTTLNKELGTDWGNSTDNRVVEWKKYISIF
jgi:hypothetical protein